MTILKTMAEELILIICNEMVPDLVLCVPTISASFEWNGKQVASLAKSGGIIYILANEDIPSLTQEVRLV